MGIYSKINTLYGNNITHKVKIALIECLVERALSKLPQARFSFGKLYETNPEVKRIMDLMYKLVEAQVLSGTEDKSIRLIFNAIFSGTSSINNSFLVLNNNTGIPFASPDYYKEDFEPKLINISAVTLMCKKSYYRTSTDEAFPKVYLLSKDNLYLLENIIPILIAYVSGTIFYYEALVLIVEALGFDIYVRDYLANGSNEVVIRVVEDNGEARICVLVNIPEGYVDLVSKETVSVNEIDINALVHITADWKSDYR